MLGDPHSITVKDTGSRCSQPSAWRSGHLGVADLARCHLGQTPLPCKLKMLGRTQGRPGGIFLSENELLLGGNEISAGAR